MKIGKWRCLVLGADWRGTDWVSFWRNGNLLFYLLSSFISHPWFCFKNTKNWYTKDALGAIFAIFTILDTFYKSFSILLQYYYNTFTILLQYFYNTIAILFQHFYNTFTILISQNISKYTIDIVDNADIVGNADIVVGNVDIVFGNVDIVVGNVDIVEFDYWSNLRQG